MPVIGIRALYVATLWLCRVFSPLLLRSDRVFAKLVLGNVGEPNGGVFPVPGIHVIF